MATIAPAIVKGLKHLQTVENHWSRFNHFQLGAALFRDVFVSSQKRFRALESDWMPRRRECGAATDADRASIERLHDRPDLVAWRRSALRFVGPLTRTPKQGHPRTASLGQDSFRQRQMFVSAPISSTGSRDELEAAGTDQLVDLTADLARVVSSMLNG